MNERIRLLAEHAWPLGRMMTDDTDQFKARIEKFAELIVQECINKIETYQISVGNSAAGEMACEMTYDALKEIRDDIKETFGLK